MAGGWGGLHNEELHKLYASSNVIRVIKSRRMRWAGHVARREELRHACKILVGNYLRKGQLGGTRSRCDDKIRMDLRE
jgi:hypothetical protein